MKVPAASTSGGRGNLLPPYQKGQSGNPAGRPMHSRQKLTEKFIDDLSKFYEVEGAALIKRVADEQPAMLLQVVARLMPKDLNLNVSGTIETELTVEQRIRIAEAWMLGRQSDRLDAIEVEAVRCDAALPESLPDGKELDEPDDDDLDDPPDREPEPVAKRSSNAGVHKQFKRPVHSRIIGSRGGNDD
jgi:hypothetical protein